MTTANGFSNIVDLPPISIAEENIAPFSLPQEVFQFRPDDAALISRFSGGDKERKIHCNIELTPEEQANLKKTQDEARRLGRVYYTSITVMATRYISYARGDVAKAIKLMDETQEWRTDFFGKGPIADSDLIADLAHGVLYFSGRDFSLRPILVVRADRLPDSWHKDGSGVTRLIRMLVFCMEYLRRYMFIPGICENIVVLIDLKNLGVSQVPVSALKSIYSVLSHHYIVRVFRFYIVNLSYMLGTLVSVVKPILTDRQRQKLVFCKVAENKDWAALHQIEEDLGGTRPKITKFFPFAFEPGPFDAGSSAGPRSNAVPNCHRAITAEGFRGRLWDPAASAQENSKLEYTEFAEDIFKACGIPIPEGCPVKAQEPPPVVEAPTPAEPAPAEPEQPAGHQSSIVQLGEEAPPKVPKPDSSQGIDATQETKMASSGTTPSQGGGFKETASTPNSATGSTDMNEASSMWVNKATTAADDDKAKDEDVNIQVKEDAKERKQPACKCKCNIM